VISAERKLKKKKGQDVCDRKGTSHRIEKEFSGGGDKKKSRMAYKKEGKTVVQREEGQGRVRTTLTSGNSVKRDCTLGGSQGGKRQTPDKEKG